MAEMITTGVWVVDDAKQEAFIEAWASFSAWASSMDGAGPLRLGRDGGDPRRFVSFGPWDSAEQVHAWKASDEFRERMGAVLRHVAEFHPTELDAVASASKGNSTVTAGATSQ